MNVEGRWASAATCKGDLRIGSVDISVVSVPPIRSFLLDNLKELLDANSKAESFWDALMFCELPDGSAGGFSHCYSEGGCSSAFDSDGCESDREYDYWSDSDEIGYDVSDYGFSDDD
ncbi:hypothetical protein TWF281_011480 [Arthrobotrys megalospora]